MICRNVSALSRISLRILLLTDLAFSLRLPIIWLHKHVEGKTERNSQWPQWPWATESPEVMLTSARSTQSPAQPGHGIAAPKTELPQVPLHLHHMQAATQARIHKQAGTGCNACQNMDRRNGILISVKFSIIIL